MPFSALLALFAALPAPTGIPAPAAVKWQLVPENNSSPITTTDSPSNTQIEAAASAAPRWQRLDGSPASITAPVRWAEAPKTPLTPAAPATAKQAIPKPTTIARSVGRAFSYGGVLYPEVGFWVPTAFRQDVAKRFSITYAYRGSPGDVSCSGLRSPVASASCTDTFWFAEATPLIAGPVSVGVNYSQQESVINADLNARYGISGTEGLGGAVGFQVKSNLDATTGLAALGVNLLGYDTGPIGSNRLRPGEKWAADLGQGYLFLASKAIPLGNWFNFDSPAILTASAGIGNGRYKTNFREGVNYGPYGFIGNVGLSLNQHLALFAEYAGQFAGVGVSLKPFKAIPLTAAVLYRDWTGLALNGENNNINCPNGDPSSCKGALDARLTFSF